MRVSPDRVQCGAPRTYPNLIIAGTQWDDSHTTTLARKVTCEACRVPVPITVKRGRIFNGTGCRVLVPFGSRRLTGVVLRCHDDVPDVPMREALRLIDAEPVLDAELLALGKWISGYYCAPLGEVLRGMLPLASDIRRGKVYSLTDAGRDAARQLLFDSAPEDPIVQILRMLQRSSWIH